jgi:putative endonuclease
MTLGPEGERIAALYLTGERYRILAKNWKALNRSGKQIGELDLVAKKGRGIVFVEVKAGRSSSAAWRPEVHMTKQKIVKLSRAAQAWLAQNRMLSQPWQIDLIAVDFSKTPPEVRHYRHANSI